MTGAFLIDECLSPRLVAVAHEHGFQAIHVLFRNLQGTPDERLMRLIRQESLIMVTSNRQDFLRLYRRENIHPGLVILVPGSLRGADQIRLFRHAVEAIEAHGDLVNSLVEVFSDGSVSISAFPE